jgi:hypothetical protein
VIRQWFADQISNAAGRSCYPLLKVFLGLLRSTRFTEAFHVAKVERSVCSDLRVQTVGVSLSKCKAFDIVSVRRLGAAEELCEF